jgi:hypothetical protein
MNTTRDVTDRFISDLVLSYAIANFDLALNFAAKI